jgi:hypothetical protein
LYTYFARPDNSHVTATPPHRHHAGCAVLADNDFNRN